MAQKYRIHLYFLGFFPVWILHMFVPETLHDPLLLFGGAGVAYFAMSYVNRELTLTNDQLKSKTVLLEQIMKTSPNAIILINAAGIIEYVSPATATVLGSDRTAGMNVLEMKTVAETPLGELIINAMNGEEGVLVDYQHLSSTTNEPRSLTVHSRPLQKDEAQGKYRAMLIINDVGAEHELLIRLEDHINKTFRSFSKIIDSRDDYTGSHSSNVVNYTTMILNEMGIADIQANQIKMAAALHDIGKVGVPDSILLKTGSLTDAEYAEIKRHSDIGASILQDIEVYDEISVIIRHHHERWDGNGYPSGISEMSIPLGSRIICIADAFDSIISDRTYRKGRTIEEALEILASEKWKQFDGELVDTFNTLIRSSIGIE